MGSFFLQILTHTPPEFTIKSPAMKKPPKTKSLLIFLLLTSVSLSYSQQLKIYHVDVDQGSATLFITPNGSTLLVDAGKNNHGARIKRILQQEGLMRIDHFVNTHYHEDHFGGIDDLARDPDITIGMAYDRGDKSFLPPAKLNEPTYIDYNTTVGRNAIQLRPGMQIPIDNAMTVTCMSQGGVVVGEQNPTTGLDENDMSLSLLITYGSFRYFIGGDMEAHTENKLADGDLVTNVDVYIANHHGSHTSSSANFMNDMIPTVVVISNGNNNSYYHPRQVTLDTFSSLTPQPVVFQTNKYLGTKPGAGNVADDFIADLDATGDEGAVLITVGAGQNNFVVTYRDKTRTFPVKNRGDAVNPRQIIVERILPDPVGADNTQESVTIHNNTSSPVSLQGWVLRDASGRIWNLGGFGQIQGNQSLTITRNGMAMSLNNDGDMIELVDASNVVIDEFRYLGAVEGVEITTGH